MDGWIKRPTDMRIAINQIFNFRFVKLLKSSYKYLYVIPLRDTPHPSTIDTSSARGAFTRGLLVGCSVTLCVVRHTGYDGLVANITTK